MNKTIQEQIEVMQHFANGGEVENLLNDGTWRIITSPTWDWWKCTYRIKEQKKTITIEKWVCSNSKGEYFIVEGDCAYINALVWVKVKRLDTYEVEL